VPGQYGLNAGVIPEPGFTYQNLALNYSANSLNNANGNGLPRITGTYQFWVDENIFVFVPKIQISRRLLRAMGFGECGKRFAGRRPRGNQFERQRGCRWLGRHGSIAFQHGLAFQPARSERRLRFYRADGSLYPQGFG
jgi:hypothetical protein